MRTLRTIAQVRAALAAAHRDAQTIGLVPTMGAFHDGHLSLMRRARAECDQVVVSLFVNPTQFNESADLERYPRDEASDAQLAAGIGVDLLFAPSAEEIYPAGFATVVSVGGISGTLEGERRGRGHFDGVTTVVTKLLHIVGPDIAYFGQKDAQQAAVISRMVRDLNMTVRIEVCATVREPDGLAMSSRNALLSADERRRAGAVPRALRAVAEAVRHGERRPTQATAAGLQELAQANIEPEYLELVSADTFAPASQIEGEILAVIAARVGGVRLIDNQPLSTTPAGSNHNRRR